MSLSFLELEESAQFNSNETWWTVTFMSLGGGKCQVEQAVSGRQSECYLKKIKKFKNCRSLSRQFSLQIYLTCVYAASQSFCIRLDTRKGICCTMWRKDKGKEEQVRRREMDSLGLPMPEPPAFLSHCFLHCIFGEKPKLCISSLAE